MNTKVVSFCVAVLLGGVSAYGQASPGNGALPSDGNLAALKALKIDAATITLLEHNTSPTLPGADARAPGNLPPRTVMKMVLSPAKGSNINVEIWLPDAGKWNGRLLSLGNGGAAGH